MGSDKFILRKLNKKVECPTCSNEYFHKRKILLNTRGLTYFDLDAFNKTATVLRCENCGRYIWFDKGIGKLERLSKSKKKTSSSTKRRTKKKRKK